MGRDTITIKNGAAEVELDVYTIAKAITEEQFAELVDNYVNGRSSGAGYRIGKELSVTHPSLQANAIHWAAGILKGLVENVKHTDPRNEWQIAVARKMVKAYEE